MRLAQNRRIRAGALFFLAHSLQKGVAIILIPINTAYLTPSEFGIIATCTALSYITGIIFFLCVYERAYFAALNREEDMGTTITTILWFELAAAMATGLMLFPAALLLNDTPIAGVAFYPYIFATTIFSLASGITNIYLLVLQGIEQTLRYALTSFAIFLCYFLLYLWFLLGIGLGVDSYLIANLLVNIPAAAYATRQLVRSFGTRFSRSHLRDAFRFSSPLTLNNGAHWIRGNFELVLLSTLQSTALTGIYHLAALYASILSLAIEAFRVVNTPRMFQLLKEPQKNGPLLAAMLPLSVGAAALIGLALSLFAKEIIMLVAAPAYWDGYQYVPLLMVSWLFFLIYINTVPVLFATERTMLISGLTSAASVLGGAMTVLLVMRLDILGAALSALAVNVFSGLLIAIYAQRTTWLPWPWPRTLALTLVPLAANLAFTLNLSIASRLALLFVSGMLVLLLVAGDLRRLLDGEGPAEASSPLGKET